MPGDKLYTLSDLSTVWLYADLYEKDIAGVQIGQPVQVASGARVQPARLAPSTLLRRRSTDHGVSSTFRPHRYSNGLSGVPTPVTR
jgi:hypothetical protein